MVAKIGSSFSCVFPSFSSPSQSKRSSQVIRQGLFGCQPIDAVQLRNAEVMKCQSIHGKLKIKERFSKRQFTFFALPDDQLPCSEIKPEGTEQEEHDLPIEEKSPLNSLYIPIERSDGRPGLISFYNRPYKRDYGIPALIPQKNQSNILWFVGPAFLVASFIFPSLYLRKILSTVFEDSLLTDFLILFFTEALFYCGVAVFLLIVDHLRRSSEAGNANFRNTAPQLEYRITSVAVLVLSLVIPMVTMGLVWPWTGPAASATLAPYLVGIIVQFAFEQYAKYVKSPSWPIIPVIFQVYRLHQLNRAAQLVTALSFTVRGAEMTSHNLAINSSLGTLLNVLQCLGVICIWSLSSFLMRFLPSAIITEQ